LLLLLVLKKKRIIMVCHGTCEVEKQHSSGKEHYDISVELHVYDAD
jgi:hypothetical protein